jgi:gliding motility-associated-like protein
MKISAVLPALLLFSLSLSAQNLVSNCDFSHYVSCPTDYGMFDLTADWYSPGEGTTDLCHTCGGGNAGIPNNMWGNEPAYSGTGYGHIICYYPFQGYTYREYMETELACPLLAGKTYRISFFVSLSDNSRYAIDGIGLLMTEDPVSQPGSGCINPGSPVTLEQTQGEPVTTKTGWKEINGIYTAIGNEKFLTIGNFMQDGDLTIIDYGGLEFQYASYYVDMVSVTPLSPWIDLGPDTTLCYGESLLVDATVPCNALYSWEDGSADPLRLITRPGTYSIEIQMGCGSVSDDITLSWGAKPGLAMPPDTIICPGSPIFLDAGPGFSNYLWQDGSGGSSFLADQAGIYWVEVIYGTGCHYRDTVIIDPLGPPVVDLGDDRVLCPGDSAMLDAGNVNGYSLYLWNDNTTGQYLTVKQDGRYYAEVSNPCGTRIDSVEISFRPCMPVLTVPNAFTPDQDGLNDVFQAYGLNISTFIMRVYNRWGELLYESYDLAEGWDGRKSGINCPSDVYVWMVYYESTALDKPQKGILKGNVALIR